ncbi:MAG: VCBS repeat-containing protein, partial [Bacteroidales bacterium]|nr:VCBS repeat-containing protein [Bacteroidales bacterium]
IHDFPTSDRFSNCLWIDLNKDDQMDVVIHDRDSTWIYINQQFEFTRIAAFSINAYSHCKMQVTDIDNDFDPDIIASGDIILNEYPSFSKLSPQTYFPPDLIETGDADNDGDVDMIYIDKSDPTTLYLNDNGAFSNSELSFPLLYDGNGNWGDYDKDGDLDLVVLYNTDGKLVAKIFRNDLNTVNAAPSPPTGLVSSTNGNRVTLSWSAGTDTETADSSLSYNMRLEKGGVIIKPTHADISNGFLKQNFRGNIGQKLNTTIKGLSDGIYTWSLQTIDVGAKGSAFASAESFEINLSNSIAPSSSQAIAPGSDGTTLTVTETGSFVFREWAYSTKHGGLLVSLSNTTTSFTPIFSDPGEYYVVCRSISETDTAISNEVLISVLFFEEIELSGVATEDIRSVQMADFDNDDDYDLLITGDSDDMVTVLYENNSNTFNAAPGFSTPAISSTSSTCFDYNNDGLIDILLTGDETSSGYSTTLFENNGGLSFSAAVSFPDAEVIEGSVDHGDIDNDGLEDLIICGIDINDEPLTKIFRNSGTGASGFTDIEAVLMPISNGSSDFIDLNNDGYIDVFLTGTDLSGNPATEYYVNDKKGNFSPSGITFNKFKASKADFGDYNNDGFFDVFIIGEDPDGFHSYVYKNIDGTIFEEIQISYNNSTYNSGSWIDFDNDGDLDILLASDNSIRTSTQDVHSANILMENLGNDQFSKNYDFKNQMTYRSSSAYQVFLYDSDSDPDFIQMTFDQNTSNYKPVVFKNLSPNVKSSPATPTGLNSIISGNDVTLSWEDNTSVSDPKVSFILTLYTGTDTIVSSQGNISSSFRKIAEYGDIHDTVWVIKNLDIGNYYWKVQCIDNSLNTSVFSEEDTINVKDLFTYSGLHPFIDVEKGGADWGDYDNDGDLDLVIAGHSSAGYDTKIYTNSGIDFQELILPLQGIYANPSMSVEWVDMNNDNFLDMVLYGNTTSSSSTGRLIKIYKNLDGNSFADAYTYSLPDNFQTCIAYGDIDNDGDIDFVSSPYKILLNEGDFNFSPVHETRIYGYYLDIVDLDNDMDFDIVDLNWSTNYIMVNEGAGNFSVTSNVFSNLTSRGETRWFDYNNDSYIDLLMTGNSDNYYITKVFTNNQDNTFTELNTILKGSAYGNVSIGDYENDGDSDFFINGKNTLEFNELYLNNYTGFDNLDYIFSENGYDGKSRMGDYDNDGDLDIISTGTKDGTGYLTTLYENTKDWPNTPPSTPDSLSHLRSGLGVILGWTEATDTESTDGGLSYNVRLGTTPGGFDIVSPQADVGTGYRRVAKIGNAQFNTQYLLETMDIGTYYWSVQAIDHSFRGGEWAPEESFIISSINVDFSNDEVCIGLSTSFTDLSVANGVVISHWDWDFGDGGTSSDQHPNYQFAAPGTYSVKLVASYMVDAVKTPGDSITKSVTVLPSITSDFSASTACFLVATDFYNNSLMNGLTATNWLWDFGDGNTSSIEDPGTNLYASAGDYNVKLKVTANNGCLDSTSNIVQVGENPDASVSADASLNFCVGDSVNFEVPYNAGYLYDWKLNGTSISDADSSFYTAKQSGSFTVEVENPIGNCFATSDSKVVSAQDPPGSHTINSVGNLTFCDGDSVVLSVSDNSDYSYQWKRNGGVTGTDTSVFVAKTSGSYSLEVSNSTGCTSTSTNTIDIIANPVPAIPTIGLTGATDFCDGESVEISVTDDPDMTYQWMDGDITISGAISNTYTATTTGNYKLVITNSVACFVQTQAKAVNVSPTPIAPTITSSGTETFCSGDSVILSVTDNPDLTYQWLLGGG